jgi:hypothetical protein
MVSGAGVNTDEVQEALKAAQEAGNLEQVRYLEGVIEYRKKRNAVVMGHEIVLGNKEAYSDEAVRQQEDVAIGRPNEPVAAEDLGVRGADSVAAAVDAAKGNEGGVEVKGENVTPAQTQPAKKSAESDKK